MREFGLDDCVGNGPDEAEECDPLHKKDLLNAHDIHTLRFICVRVRKKYVDCDLYLQVMSPRAPITGARGPS